MTWWSSFILNNHYKLLQYKAYFDIEKIIGLLTWLKIMSIVINKGTKNLGWME
ncbi:uncharacterized protein METZ01_LOCUS490999 [marine metagenome]|uniref:Uncharacterized protein n=1 Tax=marine metagenome TaxID=408172 RepID=A0A383D1L5_9ZZZZ